MLSDTHTDQISSEQANGLLAGLQPSEYAVGLNVVAEVPAAESPAAEGPTPESTTHESTTHESPAPAPAPAGEVSVPTLRQEDHVRRRQRRSGAEEFGLSLAAAVLAYGILVWLIPESWAWGLAVALAATGAGWALGRLYPL
jgi:Flp pilus assembly protein TadB